MSILTAFNWSKVAPTMLWTIVGFGIIPVIALWIGHLITFYYQRIFNSTLGPHIQVIVGFVGALIHELAQIAIAFITGHNIKFSHIMTLKDAKEGNELNNLDHNWASHHAVQDVGDFVLGVFPFYLISYLIMFWQKILGGTPFPTAVRMINLHSYLNVDMVLRTLMIDANTAFSGIGFVSMIPFVIGMVLLGSCGLNTSTNECNYAMRGLLYWVVLIVLADIIAMFASLDGSMINYATLLTNFSVCIMMRAIVYTLIMGIVIGILNVYGHTKSMIIK